MESPPAESSKVFPKNIIVRNRNIESIPIPSETGLISFIDFSNNPIRSIQNLPQLKNLEKIVGDNTLIESFEGVVEQPYLSILSLLDTPISKRKYFILMALIAFGHSLNVINDNAITTRDLDNQLKYGPIIHDYIFQGYIIESLKPTIILVKQSDGSKVSVSYSPSKSFFDLQENEKSIFSSPFSATTLSRRDFDDLVQSPHHKKIKPDPIDILNYHKAALEKFHGSLQGKKVALHQPAFDESSTIDIGSLNLSDNPE